MGLRSFAIQDASKCLPPKAIKRLAAKSIQISKKLSTLGNTEANLITLSPVCMTVESNIVQPSSGNVNGHLSTGLYAGTGQGSLSVRLKGSKEPKASGKICPHLSIIGLHLNCTLQTSSKYQVLMNSVPFRLVQGLLLQVPFDIIIQQGRMLRVIASSEH